MAEINHGDRVYGNLTVTYTKKKNLKVIYKGHNYMRYSSTKAHIWLRCTCQKEHKCQARLKISIEEPFSILYHSEVWHNHMPKHEAKVLAEVAERQMVVEAVQTRDSYTTFYGRCQNLAVFK